MHMVPPRSRMGAAIWAPVVASLTLAAIFPVGHTKSVQFVPSAPPFDGVSGEWVGTERCSRGCGTYDSVPTMKLTLPPTMGENGTYDRLGPSGWTLQAVAVVDTHPSSTLLVTGSLYNPDTQALWGSFVLEGSQASANASGTITISYGSWASVGSGRLFTWDFARPTPPAPPPFPMSRVYTAGEGGYACHRVPAVLTLPNNVVLVFAESRRPSCDDQAPKDVTMRRSTDGGKTWGPITRVIGDTVLTNNSITYRNPYPMLYMPSSGKPAIVLNCVNSTDNDPSASWPSLQLTSLDGGLTWSRPTLVKGLNNDTTVEGILGGPGYGIQLGQNAPTSPYKGRLIGCGATGYHKGHKMEAATWYSDDNGDSWAVSSTPLQSMQECQMVELTNGSIVINMRAGHMDPCDCRSVSVSHDGGATWATPWYVHDLIEPVCSAGFINTPVGQNNALFFSNPNSTNSRTHMTVKSSKEGAVWSQGALVWASAAAYSVLTELDESTLGLMFEHGNQSAYEAISLAFVPKSATGTPPNI